MTTIRNGRISTTFKYHTVPAISEFSLESLEYHDSDDDLQSVKSHLSLSSRGRAERNKIPRTEGCFITKQTGYHLEKVHWVNPVRKDPQLKYEVEQLLLGLHIVPYWFTLNSSSNLAPLDRNLHYTLNRLGLFAVTCSIPTLRDMISLVEKENKIWQDKKGVYPRRLILNKDRLLNTSYELVVLHPRHFLQQEGSALTVFTEVENGLSGKFYFVSPDGALREGPYDNEPLLPPFTTKDRPDGVDLLNPFLVVLNASIAFRRFKQLSLPPLCKHYEELIDLTLDLVEKIYFQPILDKVDAQRDERRSVYLNNGNSRMAKRRTGAVDLARNSRMENVVERPGPDASHEERVEYSLYLMSGCDYFDDDEDDSDSDYDD